MSRRILINDNYYNEASSDNEKNIYAKKYNISEDEETVGGDVQFSFTPNIPTDIDIFSELPDYVYENNDAKEFLNVLRNALLKTSLSGITLSKLGVSEHSDSELEIEWIFNYFRVYFSFDHNAGNYFGRVSSNPIDKSFSNEFKEIDKQNIPTLVSSIIDYVVSMISA